MALFGSSIRSQCGHVSGHKDGVAPVQNTIVEISGKPFFL